MLRVIRKEFSGSAAQESMPMRLKRKFYKSVDLLEVKNEKIEDFIKNTNENTNLPYANLKGSVLSKLQNLSSLKENYYQILLDNKKCKSMYLDEYKIPNKNLALILAEEWARQKDCVNLHSMQLNFYASSGIRITKDEILRDDIVNNLSNYIDSDQICFIEDKIINFVDKEENENMRHLINHIFLFMKENFDIELKKDKSFTEGLCLMRDRKESNLNREKLKKLLLLVDPWVLATLDSLIGMTKSPSVALALITNSITPKQAYLLSFSEEFYQMKKNGEVEGHHDISFEFIMGKLYSALCFNSISKL